jgi:endonuclease/exonuclease/phosphatase family metal-dependent hydrolase
MRSELLIVVYVMFAATGCVNGLDAVEDDDGPFDIGKADGSGCLPSATSDDARGVLAYANDPTVDEAQLAELGLYGNAAANIVDARPFATLGELDRVRDVGPVACRKLRRHACDVRGLCEAVLPVWTWNVKTFPLSGVTIEQVAASLSDAELVGFQEVNSLTAFDELLASLPGWAGIVGRTGFGTQVAIAFRTERLALVAVEHLWQGDPDRFPRPVLAATFEIAGRAGRSRFTVIDVHLKAQIDLDSQRRRREAIIVIERWLAERRLAGEHVIALGDWNDDIDDPPADNVFAPILARPEAYAAITLEVAARGGYSYIPFKRLIDHVVVTREAANTLQVHAVDALALETVIPSYTRTVSDHRPVRALLIPVLPR